MKQLDKPEFEEIPVEIPANAAGIAIKETSKKKEETMMKLQKLLFTCALVLTALLCLCALPQQAQAATEDDLTFTLNSDGESYSVSACREDAQGALDIPATYQGKPVTDIALYAFRDCSSLTSVTVPESVTYMNPVFINCSSLTGIWVDENNPNYSSDSFGVLFNKDKTKLIQAPGALSGTYIIPDSVISFDNIAFWHCRSLTSVTIPDGVISIGNSPFWNCSSLTSVTIPDSVTYIGHSAFLNCRSLTDIYYGGTKAQWEQIDIEEDNTTLTNATVHFNTSVFNDVNKTSWQYTHVKYALERNLMAGKGTDALGRIKFDPNSPITREEFVQVLYNAEDKPAVDLLNPFPDVVDTGWYKNAVLWAKENNIANGGGDGKFGVGARITRQDLALMLYKYAVLKNCSLETDEGITDQYGDKEKISGYAKQAMDWAVTNGILSGKGIAGQPLSEFRLDPTGTATRAECAAMLRNFMTAFGL